MFDSVVLWLHTNGAGEFLLTMLVSMLPVLEIRGGVPFGVALGLPTDVAFAAALLGNVLPVPFIILFVRKVFRWLRRRSQRLELWVDRLEKKAYAKSANIRKYQAWGLLLFVAVPLPGTGAWTGALIAALLDMRMKTAIPAIVAGVVIAGYIMTFLTNGVVGFFA